MSNDRLSYTTVVGTVYDVSDHLITRTDKYQVCLLHKSRSGNTVSLLRFSCVNCRFMACGDREGYILLLYHLWIFFFWIQQYSKRVGALNEDCVFVNRRHFCTGVFHHAVCSQTGSPNRKKGPGKKQEKKEKKGKKTKNKRQLATMAGCNIGANPPAE